MTIGHSVDGVLVQLGERFFYPGDRIVKPALTVCLDKMTQRKVTIIRPRTEGTVARRAPQVKVTGGGRCMMAIAARFRYISKNGRLEFEDDQGVVCEGKEALHDLGDQWCHAGSLFDKVVHRREAFNIMLAMPRGTDAQLEQKAAREFVQAELQVHRYVMLLQEHEANPHLHLSVPAESRGAVTA